MANFFDNNILIVSKYTIEILFFDKGSKIYNLSLKLDKTERYYLINYLFNSA